MMMLMHVVVHDGEGSHDLVLQWTDAATVGDLLAVAAAPRGRPATGLRIGDVVVGLDTLLDDCPLHEGAELAMVGHEAPWPEAAAAPAAELELTGGIDAGERFALSPGVHLVGTTADCGIRVSPAAAGGTGVLALLDVGADGSVRVTDLGPAAGTAVGGRRLAGATAQVPPGASVDIGAIECHIRPRRTGDRTAGLEGLPQATRGSGGSVPFNRVPRSAAPPMPAPLRSPEAPSPPARQAPAGGATVLAPVLTAGAMVALTGDLRYGMFALLSPVMAVATAIERRRHARREGRAEAERFRAELATFTDRLGALAAAEVERRERRAPDLAEVTRRASLPSVWMWERVRADGSSDDFLALRAGRGAVAWSPPVLDPLRAADEVAEAVAAASSLAGAPVDVELGDGGVVGIVGNRDAALAVARSLVCQAAVHHGPADLAIAVCTDGEAGAAAWDWAKWLPHTRRHGTAAGLLAGSSARSAEVLAAIVEDRRVAATDRPGAEHTGSPAVVLLVADDESLIVGRDAPARAILRGAIGPTAGIVVASSPDRLPASCTAVITVRDPAGSAELERPRRGPDRQQIQADGLSVRTARSCALVLARFHDPEQGGAPDRLPGEVRLLELLGLEGDGSAGGGALAVAERWERFEGRCEAPIGMGEEGVLAVDLDRDGPHALVAGTTGSGKSELLRTLVASMAATVDPDHLSFVLIDFKGGSAFDECGRLPHTVGVVTDLDQHEASRALRCLEAELRHRERVLREAGVGDLAAYLRAGAPRGPLPRLAVVVDEFATLKAELPSFVDSLVGVAQRGRSLGMHLVLATQRPRGAVSETIRANTDLRIALRVQDAAESSDVVGVADAASIPRTGPGRAVVRLGPREVVAFQAALVTAPDPPAALGTRRPNVVALPFVMGAACDHRAGPPRCGTGPSDLGRLVDLVGSAFAASGRPRPRRPWVEPLPTRVTLDAVLSPQRRRGDLPPQVAFAVADDPDRQCQFAFGWRPLEASLLLYGLSGSGTTTAAASVALAVAASTDPDRCHLYVLDLGGCALAPLAGLPHCGAVIGAAEGERRARLLRWLRGQLDSRRTLHAAGPAGEPSIVVVVDGYPSLEAACRNEGSVASLEDLARVVADGPEVGLHVVLTGDRLGSIPTAIASLAPQKLLFRLADTSDYALAGIAARSVPAMPPGRAVSAESGLVIQVAVPPAPLAEAVAAIAAAVADHPPRRVPTPITVLAEQVRLDEIVAATSLATRPWLVALGRRERDLGPAVLVVHPGEHVLVAGPGRSGKSSTLATIAGSMLAGAALEGRPPPQVVAVASPRSPLPAAVAGIRSFPPDRVGDALNALDASAGPCLLLIDDAEDIADPDGRLEALLTGRSGHTTEVLVAAAGRPDGLRSLYTHWTRILRRHRLGVLLQPQAELDGELLGLHLPRRSPVAMVRGRGYLVSGGEPELVQVALGPSRDTRPQIARSA